MKVPQVSVRTDFSQTRMSCLLICRHIHAVVLMPTHTHTHTHTQSCYCCTISIRSIQNNYTLNVHGHHTFMTSCHSRDDVVPLKMWRHATQEVTSCHSRGDVMPLKRWRHATQFCDLDMLIRGIRMNIWLPSILITDWQVCRFVNGKRWGGGGGGNAQRFKFHVQNCVLWAVHIGTFHVVQYR